MTNAENDIRACNNNSVNVANKMKSIQKECFWYLLCQHNCQDAVWFITMDSGTFDQFKWMSESQLKLPQKRTRKPERMHRGRKSDQKKRITTILYVVSLFDFRNTRKNIYECVVLSVEKSCVWIGGAIT